MRRAPKLGQLYDLLYLRGEVAIDDLYQGLFDREPPPDAQARLGPYVARLNKKLRPHGLIVRPGSQHKRTYAMQRL